MSDSPQISSLPLEILQEICTYFPRDQLMALRKVSHVWNTAALPGLLNTISLEMSRRSFDNLQSLANHEQLRKHVKIIAFDGRKDNFEYATNMSLDKWFKWWKDHGKFLQGCIPEQQYISSFKESESEMCRHYVGYCEYIDGQQSLLQSDNWITILSDSLSKFTGLVGLHICPKTFPNGRKYRHEHPLVPETLWQWSDQLEDDPWQILRTAAAVLPIGQLKAIRGDRMGLQNWYESAILLESPPGFIHDTFIAVHDLSLTFVSSNSKEHTKHLKSIISSATSLRSLRLNFKLLSYNDTIRNSVSLPQVFNTKSHWKDLRSLALQALLTTEDDLTSLLRRHAHTLRSLELSQMKFFVQYETQCHVHRPGYWASFIKFLNESMFLEKVNFKGTFDNCWNEGWVTRRLRSSDDDDCLRNRIERYATGRGTAPFQLRLGEDELEKLDDERGTFPWTFEDDDSWHFEGRPST